jgi:hypothetical protein
LQVDQFPTGQGPLVQEIEHYIESETEVFAAINGSFRITLGRLKDLETVRVDLAAIRVKVQIAEQILP